MNNIGLDKLTVSSSPHIHTKSSTSQIMSDVIISLIPALIASVVFFGYRALLVTAVCVISAMLSEYAFRRIIKKPSTISDLSAVVTGMILAFNLPVTIPLWMSALGSAIAIIVAKEMFGGIGQNFANPALVGRIVLMVSFPSHMTNWVKPFFWHQGAVADTITTATPLAAGAESFSYFNLFLGAKGGCIGEVSGLALIIGGVYLMFRRVILPVVPAVYIAIVGLGTFLLGYDPVHQILSGGLLLGAIYMATDYSTTPVSIKGKFYFALGCGIITVLIRAFGVLPEGVSFAILLMNILTPLIDRVSLPKAFGEAGSKA